MGGAFSDGLWVAEYLCGKERFGLGGGACPYRSARPDVHFCVMQAL
ncbi:hypothetical protein HMPREF9123_0033 [Neisseria bacilliformis ATCC BAA-1200]|uniref:Uncharacterized protein n=1 Tax=Neisseria bacilliformis ATCC BAA-1200 TaxID=888742 RepID=F2B8L3_9NEIS|nr:hypothetical protein HMPREF9123_0033 [Neisseria bacilliformis ATCC BAA-1200]